MKHSKILFKKLGFVGIGLCVACCLLPVVGVLFGLGALTIVSGFLEVVGIIAIGAAVILFALHYLRKTKAPACELDCGCKNEKEKKEFTS